MVTASHYLLRSSRFEGRSARRHGSACRTCQCRGTPSLSGQHESPVNRSHCSWQHGVRILVCFTILVLVFLRTRHIHPPAALGAASIAEVRLLLALRCLGATCLFHKSWDCRKPERHTSTCLALSGRAQPSRPCSATSAANYPLFCGNCF